MNTPLSNLVIASAVPGVSAEEVQQKLGPFIEKLMKEEEDEKKHPKSSLWETSYLQVHGNQQWNC